MHTQNTITIAGPRERIFALAAATEHWPLWLPHYRAVRVLERSDEGRHQIVEMAAFREGFPVAGIRFPVRWRSIQVSDPEAGQIIFKHTAGVAQGMWVVWTLNEPDSNGNVSVTIRHQLRYPLEVLNGWFAQDLVGRQFIEAIAGRTLATLKAKVESELHR